MLKGSPLRYSRTPPRGGCMEEARRRAESHVGQRGNEIDPAAMPGSAAVNRVCVAQKASTNDAGAPP